MPRARRSTAWPCARWSDSISRACAEPRRDQGEVRPSGAPESSPCAPTPQIVPVVLNSFPRLSQPLDWMHASWLGAGELPHTDWQSGTASELGASQLAALDSHMDSQSSSVEQE